jgi:hypothetical protein
MKRLKSTESKVSRNAVKRRPDGLKLDVVCVKFTKIIAIKMMKKMQVRRTSKSFFLKFPLSVGPSNDIGKAPIVLRRK